MKSRRKIDVTTGKVVTTSTVVLATGCGKRGYTSRKVAAEKAAQARKQTGEHIYAYRCDGCHLHHVGHRPWWAWK